MIIRLFDVENGNIIPTEHCFNLKSLKRIITEYPLNYMKVFSYIFYMTCPDPDSNPFFYLPAVDKEDMILSEVEADFSTEDDSIIAAIDMCKAMYETPTFRAYEGIAIMMDKIARYMKDSEIVDGKDGNGSFILRAAKDFNAMRQSFKEAYKDLKEEQESTVRGGADLAYDQ